MPQTLALSAGQFAVPTDTNIAQLRTAGSGSAANIQLVRNSDSVALPLSGASFVPSSSPQAPGFNYRLLANGGDVINNSNLVFSNKADTLVIASKTSATAYNNTAIASNSSFSFANGNNSFEVKGGARNLSIQSGTGNDNIKIQGSVLSGGINIQTGAGTDTVTIGGTATNAQISTEAGNDRISVTGNVTNSTFNAGLGADVLVFGGTARTSVAINLGGAADRSIDTITFNKSRVNLADLSGVTITGESSGDLLIIGSTRYVYSSTADRWVNGTTRLSF